VEAQVTKAPTTLEQRLAAALAAERVGVEDARALLSEVEAAIAEAEQAAQQHSDAAEQQRLAQTTELAGERLRTARPRLETRLRDAIAEAYCERWRLDYQRLKQRRDVAVQNFRRYPALAEELINLFAEALRRRIHRLLQQEVKKDKYGPLSFSVVVICW
jgi:hypothetical protein